jgi:hypothetical protein
MKEIDHQRSGKQPPRLIVSENLATGVVRVKRWKPKKYEDA